MIVHLDDIPIVVQPASIPGQKDLLAWEPRTEPTFLRQCNRCGENPPVIYDGKASPSGCPVCHYNEFSLVEVEEGNETMPTATAAPRKTKEEAPKANKPKGSSQAIDLKNLGIEWEEIDIELKLIDPRPGQPRKHFDEAKLNELADNIEMLGVLQRVLVQRVEDRFELIAGERRWRACQLRDRKLIPARVVTATEEQIELICLTENLQREGLSAIEEAEGYQATCQKLKCTQTQLSKKLGISQGQISNRIRLLKNPPAIRAAIISGEIDASVGRDIATWCDIPAVHDGLEKFASEGRIDKDDLLLEVCRVAYQSSRPLDAPHRLQAAGNLKIVRLAALLPNVVKRLDIRDVSAYYGAPAYPRAFNLELWDELAIPYNPDAADEDLDSDSGDNSTDEADPDEGAKPSKSAEELERERVAAAETLQEDLRFYLAGWYWRTISAWIPDADIGVIWRLFLYFACEREGACDRGPDDRLAELLTQCGGQPVVDSESRIDLWASTSTLTNPETFVCLLLARWASRQTSVFYFEDELRELEQIVKEFGIKVADVWECDREFLEVFRIPELVNLIVIDWKRKGPGASVSERDALIEWMLEENGRKKFPAPKCLTKLKLTGS